MRNQVEKLAHLFAENQTKELICDITTGRSLSYAEVERYSLQLANLISKNNIQKGDKVGIILSNGVEFLLIYFALMQIGAIAVPINSGLHAEEIKHLLGHSGIKLLFIGNEFQQRLESVVASLSGVTKIVLNVPGQSTPSATEGIDLLEEIKKHSPLAEDSFSRIQDEDIVAIMYTSGTTSQPKGVTICYRDVIANGLTFVETMQVHPGLRFLGVFSMAYMGGWYNLMLIPILSQGTVVLDQTFGANTALTFWDKVIFHKISGLWLTPTMIALLHFTGKAKQAHDYCKENIKLAMVGTAPIAQTLKKEFEDTSGIYFYENYGLSETFFISTNTPESLRTSSVGKIVRGCEVQIRDGENICDVDQEGEILVKTEYLMRGYHQEQKGEALLDRSGYFATGDVGFIDPEGYLFITGRKKDLIIRGGLNISPKQIEDKLMELEGIAEAACVGVPHNIYGEEVAVVVRLKPEYKSKLTKNAILDFASKNMAQAKYPRLVYFMDEFPKSVTGKVQKSKIKMMLQEKISVS